ncbi:glycosyltransferase [Clostridium tyrobutyricum]|uniref:glycosyltransferase family 2 protein n=1 Tax=Clostridium tyrobutyricum TaxID=1519 RepID=UPI001C388856|nr:glycosyltransferase family 2 protein [Clostridium tyrobutyricum]MBV4420082.1 glycosyltransferase [Clostridium tyrobutyricum]
MSVLVSIIVPVYNVPDKYLKTCIESLINQTMREIEIIIVDDGSKDNSGEICDMYSKQDNRIKVIHKKNGGLADARNIGFETSIGEYITFVDGDDWIESNMCEEMYKVTINQDIQLVMCGIIKDYANSSIEYKFDLENMKVYKEKECRELQAKLLIFNGNIACAYAKLINRKFLLKNKIIHDSKLRQGAEGLEFNLRLFGKVSKAIFVKQSFYHYIFNDKSISASFDEKNNEYVLKCFQKIEEYIKNDDNREKLLPNFYNRLIYVILTTAITGYFNPENKDSYGIKVKKYRYYLSNPMIQEALKKANNVGLSLTRKITLFFIRIKWFFPISLIARIRREQLMNK